MRKTEVFKIAGLLVSIDCNDIVLPRQMYDFSINTVKTPDISIEIQRIPKSKGVYKQGIMIISCEIMEIYETENDFFIYYLFPELVYGYQVSKNTGDSVIYIIEEDVHIYDTGSIELVKKGQNEKITGEEYFYNAIRDAFFFHAQKHGRVAIHSASIMYNGEVFMFSASSGTGKSTHVIQWEKAGIEFEWFNGDVTMCYLKEGKAFAAGLPWSGTSGIYRNDDVELGGVFFLKRGMEDKVETLSLSDRVICLIARCLSPNWTRDTMERNLLVIEQMVEQLIVGKLICTPTVNAANAVKEYIDDRSEV